MRKRYLLLLLLSVVLTLGIPALLGGRRVFEQLLRLNAGSALELVALVLVRWVFKTARLRLLPVLRGGAALVAAPHRLVHGMEALAQRVHRLLQLGVQVPRVGVVELLLELAHRAWEQRELAEAAAAGRAAHPDAACFDGPGRQVPAPLPLNRVVLLDRRAEDLRREYLATSPRSSVEALPVVTASAPATFTSFTGADAEMSALEPAGIVPVGLMVTPSAIQARVREHPAGQGDLQAQRW